MDVCIFCKIIAGTLPCYKIYEDQETFAFLDISNDMDGHTLVIPKAHFANVLDCPAALLSSVMATAQKLCRHYVENCGYDACNIINASGACAEQSVFHLHLHVIPRKEGDGEKIFVKHKGSDRDLASICKSLQVQA